MYTKLSNVRNSISCALAFIFLFANLDMEGMNSCS